MQKRLNQLKANKNTGAALVTVVVVVSFISILATIILYASGRNFYMKTMDGNIKESFYDAEIAMEQIKANMMIRSQEAFEEAYAETMSTYSSKVGPEDVRTEYNKKFVESFQNKWNNDVATAGSSTDLIKNMVSTTVYKNAITYDSSLIKNTGDIVPSGMDAGDHINTLSANGLFGAQNQGVIRLGTIHFSYEKDGYLTKVSTELIIKAPELKWGAGSDPSESTLSDPLVKLVDTVNYYHWTKE